MTIRICAGAAISSTVALGAITIFIAGAKRHGSHAARLAVMKPIPIDLPYRSDGTGARGGEPYRAFAISRMIERISRYLFLVPATMSGGRGGAGGRLSQSVVSSQSRTNCLS
jgi:hypothetical protein